MACWLIKGFQRIKTLIVSSEGLELGPFGKSKRLWGCWVVISIWTILILLVNSAISIPLLLHDFICSLGSFSILGTPSILGQACQYIHFLSSLSDCTHPIINCRASRSSHILIPRNRTRFSIRQIFNKAQLILNTRQFLSLSCNYRCLG